MIIKLMQPKKFTSHLIQICEDSNLNPQQISNSDFSILIPNVEKRIILSAQARKDQNRETLSDFMNKITKSLQDNTLIIPIWLTGKDNHFISNYKNKQINVSRAGFRADKTFSVQEKLYNASFQNNGLVIVYNQRENEYGEDNSVLKLYKASGVQALSRKLPDLTNCPDDIRQVLMSQPQFRNYNVKTGLQFNMLCEPETPNNLINILKFHNLNLK